MTEANDLFEPEPNDQGLFSDTDVDPDKDFASELVGDGKKYKDVNALAKKAIHADNHIRTIEEENAKLRQELQTRLSVEEFYDRVKSRTPSPSNPEPQQQDEPERTEFSIEQIDSLVGKRLQEHLTAEQQKSNLAAVQAEVERRLGPNYRKLMRDRAREVGEVEENLVNLAMNKPKLFLELMVPNTTQTHIPGLPRTQVDSGKRGAPHGVVRDSNYYANLRKSDPKRYESREVQIQMHNDALALREKFFQ
jgi:hypothetical protein